MKIKNTDELEYNQSKFRKEDRQRKMLSHKSITKEMWSLT